MGHLSWFLEGPPDFWGVLQAVWGRFFPPGRHKDWSIVASALPASSLEQAAAPVVGVSGVLPVAAWPPFC
jgi:hypothetical protein